MKTLHLQERQQLNEMLVCSGTKIRINSFIAKKIYPILLNEVGVVTDIDEDTVLAEFEECKVEVRLLMSAFEIVEDDE